MNNNNQENLEEKTEQGKIRPRRIEEEMENSYLDYAMSVIVSRALPDVRDGLKPVHRRALFAMHEMGLTFQSKFRKSAAVVGEVLAKYHPHGDVAVYDSVVRMAQNFASRYPLISGQGNFGSLDGDPPAAMRYTECKMSKIASQMLEDISKDTVDYIDNYDRSRKEPKVLPAKLPNLLINGAIGIAVGMATNIPPHNLVEVCQAIIYLVDHPDCKVDDLTNFILGPDFPTGAAIFDINEIKNAYTQGKGKVVMRAKAKILGQKKGLFEIVVSEIPFQVNKATLVTQIADLVRNKKITGVSDVRDESDKDGIRIVVDLKKDAFPKKILNQLYQYTQMQEAFHINMLALVDGIKPQVLNLKDILAEYLKHRKNVIYRRTQFDLNQAEKRVHILEGLRLALKQINEIIKTIKASKTRDDAQQKLEKKYQFTAIQANAILDMKLSTLAHLEREKIEQEYKNLVKLIEKLKDILENPPKILAIIKKELTELKTKFDSPRRTKIYQQKIENFEKEDLIPNRRVIITLTKGNYIKRLPITTYKSQHRGGKGVMGMITKEEDLVDQLLITNNHDDLLFFTSSGRVFSCKAYEIALSSRRSKGQAIVNLLQIAPNDLITGVINIAKMDSAQYLLMATQLGQVKKCRISDFGKIRKSGLIAIKLRKNDLLKWVQPATGEDQVIIVTKLGQAIKFLEKNIRPMGRSASGVRGIKLHPNDSVVGMDVVSFKRLVKDFADPELNQIKDSSRKSISADLLIVNELGSGKKTPLKNYPIQARGGIGLRTSRVTAKTGPIIQMEIVEGEKSDLIIISKKGQVIRTPIKNVKRLKRATSGVRLMRLNAGDSVASLTVLEKRIKDEDQEKTTKKKTQIKPIKKSQKVKKSKKKIPKIVKGKKSKKSGESSGSVKKLVAKKLTNRKVKKKIIVKKGKGGKLTKNPDEKIKREPTARTIPKTSSSFEKKPIMVNKPQVKTDEPNYWGSDNTVWKKKKI